MLLETSSKPDLSSQIPKPAIISACGSDL